MSEKESRISSQQNSYVFAAKLLFASLVLFFIASIFLFASQQSIFGFSDISKENFDLMVQNVQHHLNLERRDKKSSILDMTIVQVGIGIGVFAVLNFVAITGHHIVQKVHRSTNLYRSMEHVESPF
ncbi:CIC11C00000003411 [Sungouiella intermedia]|uniref:CIC11C00000003411 n=1 Tax=Sungouiella intermedia TaxID=45354 RepID=A0A1L0C4Z8_9ASCO|nr:CIC11C00000003411 [[Candida] intermedia]